MAKTSKSKKKTELTDTLADEQTIAVVETGAKSSGKKSVRKVKPEISEQTVQVNDTVKNKQETPENDNPASVTEVRLKSKHKKPKKIDGKPLDKKIEDTIPGKPQGKADAEIKPEVKVPVQETPKDIVALTPDSDNTIIRGKNYHKNKKLKKINGKPLDKRIDDTIPGKPQGKADAEIKPEVKVPVQETPKDTATLTPDSDNTIVRGKNYYKNKKRKENIKRKLEQKKLAEIDAQTEEINTVVADELPVENVVSQTEPETTSTQNKHNSQKQSPKKQKNQPQKKEETNKPKLLTQTDRKNKDKNTKKTPPPKVKKELLYSIMPEKKQLTKKQLSSEVLMKFLENVEDYLRKEAYIEAGGKLLVAVSGGVDSVVLMDSLSYLADKMKFTLYVAHFNHQLRGLSSDNDESLVRQICKDYNLHFYSGTGNVKHYSTKNSLSIEHAARILRYNFFERTARNINADIVATAHTEDDLVETFFINLFRGSGLTGLSSMPSKRKFVKNVTLVRPFLQFNKAELYQYAEIRNLKWNEDETNSLLNYTRNKIRHDLIPKLKNEYNPSIIQTINRTAELIQGADEVIKDFVVKTAPNIIEESSNEKFSLKINMLLTLNRFMQGEVLQYAWSKYFRLQPMSLAVIDRILELTDKQTGSICEISSAYFVLRDRNNLIFAKRAKEVSTSLIIEKPGLYKLGKNKLEITEVQWQDVKFSEDKNVEYIPADMALPFLEIRNKREGDIFHPLGAPGEMKLSDFLTNEKVSLIDKTNVLILTNRIHVLWVLGYRISEKARVGKKTSKIYRLRLLSNEK